MLISINAKGLKIGENLRLKLEKKLDKYQKFFDDETRASIKLSKEASLKKIEITIYKGRTILRAEAREEELLEALDRAIYLMDRQIRKSKTKIEKSKRDFSLLKSYMQDVSKDYEEEGLEEVDEKNLKNVIKRKNFEIEVMTVEEACLEMELLNHDFLLFVMEETKQVALVYRRRDGAYGLIEPVY